MWHVCTVFTLSENSYIGVLCVLTLTGRLHVLRPGHCVRWLLRPFSREDMRGKAGHRTPLTRFFSFFLSFSFLLFFISFSFFFLSFHKNLHLSEDVAGATFMAAGSSAPELFTSVIGENNTDCSLFYIASCNIYNFLFCLKWLIDRCKGTVQFINYFFLYFIFLM